MTVGIHQSRQHSGAVEIVHYGLRINQGIDVVHDCPGQLCDRREQIPPQRWVACHPWLK